MSVRRIVPNVKVDDPEAVAAFYREILELDLLMDLGWIHTYGNSSEMTVQISLATEGGSGTPVPDLSVEVDNYDEVLARVKQQKIPIEYGPVTEPWGVARFYIRDPSGKLINVLQHI